MLVACAKFCLDATLWSFTQETEKEANLIVRRGPALHCNGTQGSKGGRCGPGPKTKLSPLMKTEWQNGQPCVPNAVSWRAIRCTDPPLQLFWRVWPRYAPPRRVLTGGVYSAGRATAVPGTDVALANLSTCQKTKRHWQPNSAYKTANQRGQMRVFFPARFE